MPHNRNSTAVYATLTFLMSLNILVTLTLTSASNNALTAKSEDGGSANDILRAVVSE